MRAVIDTNILVRAMLNPEGSVDVIVTGDEDLEALDPFEGISMIQPARFLRRLRQSLDPKSSAVDSP